MSKDPNQLHFETPAPEIEPVTSRNLGHTVVHVEEVPDDFDRLSNTFNATQIRQILGETAVSAPNTAPSQPVPAKESKYPRSRRGLSAAGLRAADNDRKFRPER